MLFALEWMKNTWAAMVSAIHSFTEGLELFSVSAAICSFLPVLLICLVAGIIWCFLGFRFHKFVHGIIGGILLGALGWNIGRVIKAEQVSIAAVYAAMLAIAGFFVLYMFYFLNVFGGSFFFFLAALATFEIVFQEYVFLIAAILALIYCILYVKYEMVMTAVTGAILLSLVVLNISPVISGILGCGCTAAGIWIQTVLRHRYEARETQLMQEQLEKYPYGPGLVYGWPDPTLSKGQKKKG